MDCYSMALFVVCFDVMIMMMLIFPSTETKMAFTQYRWSFPPLSTVGFCSSMEGMMENMTLLLWRCGKDKFGSGCHFFPTKLLLHQM